MRSLNLLFAAVLGSISLPAQSYATTVLVRGLDAPTGIAVHDSGDLYFTELPVPGQQDQRNTVSMWSAAAGTVTALVRGEPGPTNIAVFPNRDYVWTCNTAGPILRGSSGGGITRLATGDHPSGIAIANGRIFVTQVPQPGMGGGNNRVDELAGGAFINLSMGEPEPVDVAADASGNLFWTCKSAGVILRWDAVSRTRSMLLNGLDHPSGITVDAAGNVYFTELPTPGRSGANGGSNRVWKYDPATRNLTLVHFGDPDPVDIAVAADGSRVYWTCRTAGVIVRADRAPGPVARVLASGTTNIGDTVDLEFDAPAAAGRMYVAASSGGSGPLFLGMEPIALSWDGLLQATAMGMGAPTFAGYVGQLDGTGRARGSIRIPPIPALRDLRLFTAFVTVNFQQPTGVGEISSSLRLQVR